MKRNATVARMIGSSGVLELATLWGGVRLRVLCPTHEQNLPAAAECRCEIIHDSVHPILEIAD